MQILLAIVVINLFVLLLCSLTALSLHFLSQSGKAEIVINDREPREADCGQTLFEALGQAEVYLPAACGGKGTCGRCQISNVTGGGPLTPLEQVNLTPEQLAAGIRLACQIKVRQNVRLQVAKELLAAKSYLVELVASEPVAEDIKTLTFRLPEGQRLEFIAGQYLQTFYRLPLEKAVRAYSLSSAASTRDSFSFDVQRVEGGLMSNYLHQMPIGRKIEVCGPFGEMFLQETDALAPIVLIAGGVGLAPMRSMIESLREWGFKEKVLLFHGARSRKNLYGEKYYRELEQTYKNFRYVPALSNPLIEEGWTGSRGMVHQTLEQLLPENVFASAYICGPAPMMQAVTKVLVAKGMPSDRIFTDPFDF